MLPLVTSTQPLSCPLAEPGRLAALAETGLLDTPPEVAFDRLTRLAALALGASTAAISIVTADRQFCKSVYAGPAADAAADVPASAREVPLSHSICQHVVRTGEPLLIDDARTHPLVRDGAAVRELGIAAYAGVPLATASGAVLGSLCVVDTQPRAWTTRDRDVLLGIAASVMTEVELRHELAQRREAESAARRSREQLEYILETLPSIVYHVEPKPPWAPVFVSRAIEMLGFPRDEYFRVPDLWTRRLHPDDRARVLGEIAEARSRGEPLEQRYRMVARDGTVHCFHDRGRFIRDADGRLTVWQGVMTDVTAQEAVQEAAQQALRASEERFRALVENTAELITVLDAAGRVVYASPTWATERGIAPETLIGTPGLDLIHPDDAPTVSALFRELATTPGASQRAEYRARHGDGSWRVMSTVAENMLHVPAVSGIVVNSRDVTEQRIIEAQLRQAQKMEAVGQLAGGVAHDFNNLLTVIKLHAQFVLDALPAGGDEYADVREIAVAADRAANLTRQLLAFSRKQMLKPVVLELDPLVSGICPMLRRLIGEDIEVRTRLAAVRAPVLADPGQLEQVVVNLVVNARDAMPDGGRLTIETAVAEVDRGRALEIGEIAPGRYATLAVRDTGCGMDRDTMGRIFEPFFTTKEKGQGTGLGLATVYGIVRQSGGGITVESAVGAGSTFTIYLPCVPQAAATPADSATGADAGRAGTVLVVEDDDAVRRLASRVLRQHGYTLLEAGTGREAVAIVLDHDGPLDLVLSDVVMPDMGGGALREWLAGARPDVPVLLMTGYTDDEMIRRGVREQSTRGGLPLIQKPFAVETLVSAVRETIERQRKGNA